LIATLAAGQKGLVRRDQLREAGVGRGAIAHRLATHRLFEIHDGVFAAGHAHLTPQARWLAAVWALGEAAILSHVTAAAAWRVLPYTADLHVTIPTTSGREHRDGIHVHRQAVPAHHRTVLHGIPVTALIRTILDLAATAPLKTLERAFEQAQVIHHLAPAHLEVEALIRNGHRGNGRLKLVLADAVAPGQVESILELRFLKFCRDHDLPRPLTQVRFGPWRADFLFNEERVVVETDSARFHATAARRRKDAEKTVYIEAAGSQVERLRWADVVHAPVATAGRLHDVLQRRRLSRSA
jgi:very-short-patch-repair endonuclease